MNILFICPSEYWSTIERTALRDCKLLKQQGHQAYLYCLQDSFLDIKAREAGLKIIPHHGKLSTSVIRWKKLAHLSNLIQDFNIQIVQCYDIHMLWPVSYFLRNKPLIPLIFSHNVEVQKIYRQMWYRPLISRIDVTLIPNREMLEGVVGSLGMAAHKIENCGLGVGEEKLGQRLTENSEYGHFLENFQDHWLFACYVGAHETSIGFLQPIFEALKVLNQLRPQGKACKLVLISDKPWDQTLIYPELRTELIDAELDQDVLFESKTSVIRLQQWIDLWIGLRSYEAIEDYTVTALLGGVPVVLTRSTTSVELLRLNQALGRTYKKNDSRELRTKILEILENMERNQKQIQNSYEKLKELFGIETYRDQLLNIFQKSLQKRARFYRRKKLVLGA